MNSGGEGEIRTLERLPVTRFPGVRLRPLGHLTLIYQPHRLQMARTIRSRLFCVNPAAPVLSKLLFLKDFLQCLNINEPPIMTAEINILQN